MTARAKLTTAQRRAIAERQGWICPWCNKAIHRYGYFEIDHQWAIARGGPDSDDNRRALHQACHREKTGGDVKEIAKTKRLVEGHEAHRNARATRTRRPNAKQRRRAAWDANRIAPETPRQE